jgi:hypothetical protein
VARRQAKHGIATLSIGWQQVPARAGGDEDVETNRFSHYLIEGLTEAGRSRAATWSERACLPHGAQRVCHLPVAHVAAALRRDLLPPSAAHADNWVQGRRLPPIFRRSPGASSSSSKRYSTDDQVLGNVIDARPRIPVHRWVAADPDFAMGFSREGIDIVLTGDMGLTGDVGTGKSILYDYIKRVAGFEELGEATGLQPKSLVRMLKSHGNRQARRLSGVVDYLQQRADIQFRGARRMRQTDYCYKLIICPARRYHATCTRPTRYFGEVSVSRRRKTYHGSPQQHRNDVSIASSAALQARASNGPDKAREDRSDWCNQVRVPLRGHLGIEQPAAASTSLRHARRRPQGPDSGLHLPDSSTLIAHTSIGLGALGKAPRRGPTRSDNVPIARG